MIPKTVFKSRILQINGYFKLVHPNKDSIKYMNDNFIKIKNDSWILSDKIFINELKNFLILNRFI